MNAEYFVHWASLSINPMEIAKSNKVEGATINFEIQDARLVLHLTCANSSCRFLSLSSRFFLQES